MNIERLKIFISSRKAIVENATYLSILQIVLLLAPLITYPYLVGVLGMELYGVIISAQILVSYASIIIDFGTNTVCAKHISINRNNKIVLAEIVSSVWVIRFIMAVACLGPYLLIIYAIPSYREFFLLFILSYGMVMQDVLFPQFFFQGIEEMKYATILSVLFKAIFIALIFIIVKSSSDYILVPILYVFGYTVSSLTGVYLVVKKMGIHPYLPKWKRIEVYLKDSSPLLATNVVCLIKDKFSYIFIGASIGMSEVVIYDLGIKLNGLISKPVNILETVMFPRFAQSRNFDNIKKFVLISFVCSFLMCLGLNLFLPWVVEFFLHKSIDMLPIRILSIAPIILSVSVILGNDFMVAFGYNKYMFYSILITTIAYVFLLLLAILFHINHSLYTFVFLAVATYFVELLYRLYATKKILRNENF